MAPVLRASEVARIAPAVGGLASQGSTDNLVLCFGEMLIDFVPTENGVSLAEAPGFIPAPGGAPANVAVGVSRLGGRAAFVGKVGDEEFGRHLVAILEKNGVEVGGVRFDKDARTALAFVTLKADGEREFMFYRNPSADMLLTPEELDKGLIAQASVVHYGSISLIAEPCRSAHLKLLELAAESGAILSYDANLRLPLWPSEAAAKEGLLSIWDKAHVAKLSDEEVEFLTAPEAQPSAAAKSTFGAKLDGLDQIGRRALSLWHDGLRCLLVTEGSKGSRYFSRLGGLGFVPGFKVKAIDATGAGDAFVAGFLVQLAESPSLLDSEEQLRKAVALANACGAITTTKRGAIPSLPTLEAAMLLMEGSLAK